MSNKVIESAIARQREVFGALASASGADDAAQAIANVLGVPADQAREVLLTPVESLLGADTGTSPASGSSGFALVPFRNSDSHKELFHARSSDATSATGGDWSAEKTEAELKAGLERVDAESAMWFVAVDTSRDAMVGLVFGEQVNDGDVDVAIWVRPEERKRGFGLSSLKECRRELAAFFPGKNVVVRAPLPGNK